MEINYFPLSKGLFVHICSILIFSCLLCNGRVAALRPVSSRTIFDKDHTMASYDSLKLGYLGLSSDAFNFAIRGYDSLRSIGILRNSGILSIVDFSLPSSKRRLFVIDIVSRKLLFNTFVSHGRNSGKEMATHFSNDSHSYQSSLGFYITGQTYSGHHGYSLRLQGMERGINDNAYSRGIVMHAAKYVNEKTVGGDGCVGRSEGCPAIPVNIHRAVIEAIKQGTCLLLYGSDKKYLALSKFRRKASEERS
jgi:hypothetical protein